jgi:type III pantothenate kinase
MSTIAVFDIGNTSLKYTHATNGKCGNVTLCEHAATSQRKLSQELRSLARTEDLSGAIACCVAPKQGTRIREAWRSVSRRPLVFLNHRMKMPIELKYAQPATIGSDRLAAASASFNRLKCAHMVIDAGTAVTVDCVDGKGRFLGGAIAPGPAVMTDYLSSNTGLLPQMNYSGAVPNVGRSTEGAMRIGVRVGYASMLNSIVEHLRTGAFAGADVPILVTGGYAKRIVKRMDGNFRIVNYMTLEGLALVYEMNV